MDIAIEKIPELVERSGEIYLKPEGEDVLSLFLDIKAKVDAAEEMIKKSLEQKALEMDPNFKKIQGDKIKILYNSSAPVFFLDKSLIDQIDPTLLKIKEAETTYSPNTKAIEDWSKKRGGLPYGFTKNDNRNKTIKIKLVGGKDEEE